MGKIFNVLVKYKDYPNLKDQDRELLTEYMESVLPNPELAGRKPLQDDFWFLSWNDIETLRSDLENQNLEDVLKLVYSLKENEIKKIEVVKIISSYKWVIRQLESIAEIEKYELGESKQDPKEISAGIENFREFGFYNSLHLLSEGDPVKENQILELPYWQIFRNLKMRNVKREFERAYSQLK